MANWDITIEMSAYVIFLLGLFWFFLFGPDIACRIPDVTSTKRRPRHCIVFAPYKPDPMEEIAVYPTLPVKDNSLLELGQHLQTWQALHPEVTEIHFLSALLDNRLPPPNGACVSFNGEAWKERCWVGVWADVVEIEQVIKSLKESIPPTLMRDARWSGWEFM